MPYQRPFTFGHALGWSLAMVIGTAAWVARATAIGLPFHPWCSIAIGGALLLICFFFVNLDPAAIRLFKNLKGLLLIIVFLSIGLAAARSPVGAAFPFWAKAPILAIEGAIATALLYFGIRSFVREMHSRLRRLD